MAYKIMAYDGGDSKFLGVFGRVGNLENRKRTFSISSDKSGSSDATVVADFEEVRSWWPHGGLLYALPSAIGNTPDKVPQGEGLFSPGKTTIQFESTRIRIGNIFADGAQGQVLNGYDLEKEERYAVKRPKKGPLFLTDGFSTEYHAIQDLSSEHVIKAASAKDQRGVVSLVMPYAKDGDLTSFLEAVQKMDFLSGKYLLKAWIFYKIAQGLKDMHQANRIHLDVKTDNILMLQGINPKIADLGLSLTSEQVLKLRTPLGTNPYMAPEMLALGEQDACILFPDKLDVFALGQLMHKVIWGYYFHERFSQDSLKANTPSGADEIDGYLHFYRRCLPIEIPKLLDAKGCVLADIDRLTLLMLQFDPEKRPAMESVVQTLSDYFYTMGHPDQIQESLMAISKEIRASRGL